jgi:hypothetical protein
VGPVRPLLSSPFRALRALPPSPNGRGNLTRVITGALGAYLAGTEAVVADCLMVVRRDGTRFGFTTIDVTVTAADLGEGDESMTRA